MTAAKDGCVDQTHTRELPVASDAVMIASELIYGQEKIAPSLGRICPYAKPG